MGAWGTKPWDNDGAADWFADFFEGLKPTEKIKAAFKYDDDYDRLRAACFILGSIGRVYVWPDDLDELKRLLEQGISLLSELIDTENDENDFLELWDSDPEVIQSVQQQIEELKARRAEMK